MANKQDLRNAISVNEIANRLNLNMFNGKRDWHIQATCATDGDGIFEGLDWLSNTLGRCTILVIA